MTFSTHSMTADQFANDLLAKGWVAVFHSMIKGVFILGQDYDAFRAGEVVDAVEMTNEVDGKILTNKLGELTMDRTLGLIFDSYADII